MRSRPLVVYFYLVAAVGVGVTALVGGGLLVLDPTGSSLALPGAWLDGTPFGNYLIPGAIMLVVLGVGPFAVTYAILTRRPWAHTAAVALGIALIGWILVQIALLQRYHLFHAIYGGLGAGLVWLATREPMRSWLGA